MTGADLRSAERRVWRGMINRCHCKSSSGYPRYGARGIIVCVRWRFDFEAFFSDMGPRPSDEHQIDRVDSKGSYSPENCRWATREVQQRNRSCIRWLEFGGERLPLEAMATKHGVDPTTLRYRLRAGWDLVRALNPAPGLDRCVVLGERNGQSRLTATVVAEIRAESAAGVTGRELARRYGVTEGHVSEILSGKRWGHTLAKAEETRT